MKKPLPPFPMMLPDDAVALKDLVASMALTIHQLNTRIDTLLEQLRLGRRREFTSNRDTCDHQADLFFNEAEAAGPVEDDACAEYASADIIQDRISDVEPLVKEKKKPGRRALNPALPRIDIIHDLPEHEKTCVCGCLLTFIGSEITEQLDIIPAQVQVLAHHRQKYVCRGCKGAPITARLPPQLIPGGQLSASTYAYIAVAKYVDALPLYRQEVICDRLGFPLPRNTLAHAMMNVSDALQPLLNCLFDYLFEGIYLQLDESVLQVLKEPGRDAEQPSRMWICRGGLADKPVVWFHYSEERTAAVARELIGDFTGYVQSDGYGAYDSACKNNKNLMQLGCCAHGRRYFVEAVNAQPIDQIDQITRAHQGVAFFDKLYQLEDEIKHLPPEEKYQQRQQYAVPIGVKFRAWLDKTLHEIKPQGKLGKALNYAHRQWDKLLRYCDNGHLNIDNNLAENALRPFVLGRKNWLFAATPHGAHASAKLYSVMETAKANGLEPYSYLKHVFEILPTLLRQNGTVDLDGLEALLPWNCKGICQAKFVEENKNRRGKMAKLKFSAIHQ